MSYRDRHRISGYRSQPVSNRSSLYLPTDYNVSNFTDDLSDFDRQFKKLLERTEKFTNRVEKLQTTATHIKKGFRRIDNTVTGIRSQRDDIETAFDSIESRLYNDVEEPPSTEEEWKQFLDAGVLIEKAVELLRNRHRYPKSSFEYSPEDRSPYSYDVSPSTVLVSNPHSPVDAEGNRIRDIGSEFRPLVPNCHVETTNSFSKRMQKIEKPLSPLSEDINESSEADPVILRRSKRGTDSDAQANEINGFVSSSLFKNEQDTPISAANSTNDNTNTSEMVPGGARRPSFLRTLKNAANKKPARPKTMYEMSSADFAENKLNKEKIEKSEPDENDFERTNSMHSNLDTVAKSITTSFQSSANSSLSTSLNLRQEENTPNSFTPLKRSSSSSFHEYNPSNRIPLKERLRMKQEAEEKSQKVETKTETKITANSSLTQRASRLVKIKNKEDDSHNSSFTSRFLRRFRSSNKNETTNSTEESTSRRRRTRKRSDEDDLPVDVSETDLTSLVREKRETDDWKRKNSEKNEEKNPRSSFIKKEKMEAIDSVKITNNNDKKKEVSDHQKIDGRRRRKTRPLSIENNVDLFDSTPTRKFSDIISTIRPDTSTPTKEVEEKSVDNKCDAAVVRRRRQTRTKSQDSDEENKTTTERGKKQTDNNNNETVETPKERVVRRPTKKDDVADDATINRKSLIIYEENIVPTKATREERIVEFKTPKGSLEEVSEEEIQIVDKDRKIVLDMFQVLRLSQRQVTEDEVPLMTIETKCTVDDDALERVYQISPPEKKKTFPIEEDDTESSSDPLLRVSVFEESIVHEISEIKTTVEETNLMDSPSEKKASIDDMLEEFNRINNEMYVGLIDQEKSPRNDKEYNDNRVEVCDKETDTTRTKNLSTDSSPVREQKKNTDPDPERTHEVYTETSNNRKCVEVDGVETVTGDNVQNTVTERTSPTHKYNIILDSNGSTLSTFPKYMGKNVDEENDGKSDQPAANTVRITQGEKAKEPSSKESVFDSVIDDDVKIMLSKRKSSDKILTGSSKQNEHVESIAIANEGTKELCLDEYAETSSISANHATTIRMENVLSGSFTENEESKPSLDMKEETNVLKVFEDMQVSDCSTEVTEAKSTEAKGETSCNETNLTNIDSKNYISEEHRIFDNFDFSNLSKSMKDKERCKSTISVNEKAFSNQSQTPMLAEQGRSSSMGSLKKRLSYLEKREAHMKLLLGENYKLNDSITSLLENVENKAPEEHGADIPTDPITAISPPLSTGASSITSVVDTKTNGDQEKFEYTCFPVEILNSENRPTSVADIDQSRPTTAPNELTIDFLSSADKATLNLSFSSHSTYKEDVTISAENSILCSTLTNERPAEIIISSTPITSTTNITSSIPTTPTNDDVFPSLTNKIFGASRKNSNNGETKSQSSSTSSMSPVLGKQMSIKEYRRRKLESQETSSCSDESIFEKSDVDKSMVSSLADVSDISDDNRCRNKRYSHSKKDLRDIGRTSSSSESDVNVNYDDKKNTNMNYLFRNSRNPIEMQSDPSEYKNGENRRRSRGGTVSTTDRKMRYMKYSHKSSDL